MYWLHVPNTIIGTPILLSGHGPTMRCDSGSLNMQLEFSASFAAKNTRIADKPGFDTAQKNRASFEREDGASWSSGDELDEPARTGGAARHAGQCAELR